MPLYEYGCENCKQVHEVMQKFSDAPLTQCPTCNGPVRKLMSRTSFTLKGSGWYSTDYKCSSPSNTACTPTAKAAGGCCSGGSCPH